MSNLGQMPEGGCHGTQEWISGTVTDSCPVVYTATYNVLFESYVWCERGFMPYGKGWAEQPTGLIAGLNILYQTAAAVEHERAAREQNVIQPQ